MKDQIKQKYLGQMLYSCITTEGMGTDIIEFYNIVDINDDYLTTCNVKVELRNHKWYPSNKLGDTKTKYKLVYSRKSTKSKKDKDKLIERAVEQLNLSYCSDYVWDLPGDSWKCVTDGCKLERR